MKVHSYQAFMTQEYKMELTGERMIPEFNKNDPTYFDYLAKYFLPPNSSNEKCLWKLPGLAGMGPTIF